MASTKKMAGAVAPRRAKAQQGPTAVTPGTAKSKVCSQCQKRKPWDQFAKNSAHSDGLQSDCRECKREREATYRAAKKAA